MEEEVRDALNEIVKRVNALTLEVYSSAENPNLPPPLERYDDTY